MICITLMFSLPAAAELSLSVNDVITGRGQFKSEMSITYANIDRRYLTLGESLVIQTGPTSFLSVPSDIRERNINSDTFVSVVGARYGLSTDSECYVRISSTRSHQRRFIEKSIGDQVITDVSDAWLGIAHQIKAQDAVPPIYGFLELAIEERVSQSSTNFNTLSIGVTSYKVVDPVVFSLAVSGRHGKQRLARSLPYQPGNIYMVNPSITLAVNDQVTITGGVQWTWMEADRVNNTDIGIDRSSTDLMTGVGYVVSDRSTINTSLNVNASGQSGAEVRMVLLYTH